MTTPGNYLVAAASSGLGLAVARALIAEGAVVSICGRDAARVDAAVKDLDADGRAFGFAVDLTSPTGPREWASWSTEQMTGPLHGVFINTGGPAPKAFDATSDDDWTDGFGAIVMPAVRLARTARELLAPGGSVVFSTSSVVRQPALTPELVVSAALRSSVATLAKSLSREWAPDIRVNQIIPGRIATDRVASLDARRASASGVTVEDVVARSVATIPAGRYGDPAEFGQAAAWLLGPASSYVSGSALTVDGGLVSAL